MSDLDQQVSPDPAPAASRRVKPAFWIGIVVLAAFLGFGLSAFRKTLTPYVSFAEARKATAVVQVAGALVKGSDRYDSSSQELSFDIADEKNDRMRIVYAGVKPGNFNDATSVVAIGRYDGKAVRAEKLLVKCPSKYQGQEVEKSYAASPKAPS
jgi:cytochrome c-type biogenesis protein CcmE